MDRDGARMFAWTIIDIFEDWLDEKGCTSMDFWNQDKEDRGCPDEMAIIYGEDYYLLEDKIVDFVRRRGLLSDESRTIALPGDRELVIDTVNSVTFHLEYYDSGDLMAEGCIPDEVLAKYEGRWEDLSDYMLDNFELELDEDEYETEA